MIAAAASRKNIFCVRFIWQDSDQRVGECYSEKMDKAIKVKIASTEAEKWPRACFRDGSLLRFV
jgi:hypothetical protein